MSSSKTKVFSGNEFAGSDQLEASDINNWIVEGFGGEAAKTVLDDFEWNGAVVMGITLKTSPDNKKIVGSNIFLTGELMRGSKEIRANRLFNDADKDLRIVYSVEEASILSFKSGTMIGDYFDDDKITWNVIKKTNRGSTEVEVADYESQNIGSFCIRPFVVPLSPSKARVTLLAFPLSVAQIEAQHPHFKKAAFPGLEILQHDVDIFPQMSSDAGKVWGCPLIPLFLLGGNLEDNNAIPPTSAIKAAVSTTLRATVVPTTKRDLRTLSTAWTAIQESGPSKLKERIPDTLWPLWTEEGSRVQHGKIKISFEFTHS